MIHHAQALTTQKEYVVLVDENDNECGAMEKMEAHEKGALHRAFSLFVYNDKGEMLLQQRALHKYHSAGLWTNACCSHPRINESLQDAVNRRVQEEMGFLCESQFVFSFIYRADMPENNLIEHELDHVFIGKFSGIPHLNPMEVANYEYVSIPEIRRRIAKNPDIFTAWFKIAFEKVCAATAF